MKTIMPRPLSTKRSSIDLCRIYVITFIFLNLHGNAFIAEPECNRNHQDNCKNSRPFALAQKFEGPSNLKPSVILIIPQSFKVPTNPSQAENESNRVYDKTQLQQYVAVVNNVRNERDDQLIRQQYKKLSLQVRDAKHPSTGQLFYEHVFDYFAPNQKGHHILIPINLDQVTSVHEQHGPTNEHDQGRKPLFAASSNERDHVSSLSVDRRAAISTATDDSKKSYRRPAAVVYPQQLILSIRPHGIDLESSQENTEIVRSAPIPVEPIPSSDGRRSFSIVQTDKPVYKPDDKVRIRSLIINENLRPIINDEFRLQVKNPHQIVVEEARFPRLPQKSTFNTDRESEIQTREPLFIDHVFEFPPDPMLGTWFVQLLHSDPVANDTTSFEVQEYVSPPFEISINIPRYILPSTSVIKGSVTAKYHHGEPVQGKVQMKFGWREAVSSKIGFLVRTTIKTLDPVTGSTEFTVPTARLMEKKWFPEIAGHRLVVEATVTEISTGHHETAQDMSCIFLRTRYRLSFENSIVDFKTGLTQQLSVQLVDGLTNEPGPAGEKIIASYQDANGTALDAAAIATDNHPVDLGKRFDTEATTDHLGRAVFNIGLNDQTLEQIKVSFKVFGDTQSNSTQQQISSHFPGPFELALGQHTLNKYESTNGWIYLMNKTVTHLNIDDEFISDILIRDNIVISHKIFYLITARGRIIFMDSLDSDGLVRFKITENMMPTMRIVLFALTHDSVGLMSDSMRISIGHNLHCGLSVSYKSGGESNPSTIKHRPNEEGTLLIQARQGDLVSLIGVDSAIYSLSNRTRLDALRIIERIKRLDLGCGYGGGGINNMDVFHNAGLMLFKDSLDLETSNDVSLASYIGSSCLSMQSHIRYLDEAKMGYVKPILSHLNRGRLVAGPYVQGGRRNIRNKREVNISEMLRRYKDPLHRACCRLGTMEDFPQRRNCVTRSEIVRKYMPRSRDVKFDCSHIYHTCCSAVFDATLFATMVEPRVVPEFRKHPLQYSEPMHSPNTAQLDQFEASTLVRKDFRETWLFDLVPVTGADGSASIDVRIPHSITSWSLSAVALNEHKPMCIMPRPYKIISSQEVFLRVSMPYKVVQGEQIDLVAKVFNYSPQPQDVFVYMYGVKDVCSEAEPGERSERKRVRVDKHSTQAVLLPIIPLRTGKFPIKIVAVALSSNLSDIVEHQLNVVSRGRLVTEETTFSLDPMNHQKRSKRAIETGNLVDEIDSSRGLQRSKVRLTPSRDAEYIVPQTQECIVSAIGDKLGQAVQTTMLDVENLIRLPYGCGEQVMIYLGPTLYTAKYLSSLGKLSGDTRWRAIRYIQKGYTRILNFRKENGAFSAFVDRDPSIWLTAFVVKLLCQTEKTPFIANEVHVDKTIVNEALKWLILMQNKTTGGWIERNPVYHREMLGGAFRVDVLTAFVSISLNECSHHAQDLIEELPNDSKWQQALSTLGESRDDFPIYQQTQGMDLLRKSLDLAESTLILNRYSAVKDKNPYILALIAHALSASNPREATSVLADLMQLSERSHSRNQLSWRGYNQIETAAYALQALIETAPFATPRDRRVKSDNGWLFGADAIAVANWLLNQRSYTGAFESTQDTVVALEALSKFAQVQSDPAAGSLSPYWGVTESPKLTCNVTVSNRTKRSIRFSNDNAQIIQTFKLDSSDLDPTTGETLDIITSGTGQGTMSIKLKYNVFQEEDELCRFDIYSSIDEWRPPLVHPASADVNKDFDRGEDDEQLDSGKVPQVNQSNTTEIEEDYFKTFDKSMLSELNLIDSASVIKSADSHTSTMQSIKPKLVDISHQQIKPILRLKREAHDIVAASNGDSGESWTAKVVSTIKSRLPLSWIGSKIQHEITTTPSANTSTSLSDHSRHHAQPTLDVTRRNGTSRRSAHGAPMISQPSQGMPIGARLNNLSDRFEIISQNKSTDLHLNSTNQASPNDLAQRLVLLLHICVHHMARRDSEMAIIETGILSGFKPNEADLKEIINDPDTPAMKYELSTDRSLVNIYLQHIPNSGPYCFRFRLIRDSLVYNLQSGYIRVYEYYQPRHSCSNFYTPSRVSDLIRTKCDSTGQVCQCASRSFCPATSKLVELSEIHQVNTTSARNKLVDLVCSNRFDLVSIVKLKSVRYLEIVKVFKITVKVKTDLRGNLTKIVDLQRQQKSLLSGSVRKPQHTTIASPTSSFASVDAPSSAPSVEEISEDDTSLDHLSMTLDSSCARDDPFLLHLAHPNQWKQGGELMIIFARSEQIEKKSFRATAKQGPTVSNRNTPVAPRPKPNTWGKNKETPAIANGDQDTALTFSDAQKLQYSLHLPLDRDTIIHDITYQDKVGPREALKNLILWLELRSRREGWSC